MTIIDRSACCCAKSVARLVRARARAFERCKAAFAAHEFCPAPEVAQARGETADMLRSTLYMPADPAQALAKVIVRELDAMLPGDGRWMQRFGDLESAFALHLAAPKNSRALTSKG